MVRPIDQETIAIEKTAYFSQLQGGGGVPHGGGAQEEAPGSVKEQRERGNMVESLYCGFCGGIRKGGKQAGLSHFRALRHRGCP